MIRWPLAGVCCLLLVTGCGDTRTPTVQKETAKPDPHSSTTGMPADSMHGMPPGMPHGGAPGAALGPVVRLGSMYMKGPESWVRKPLASAFLLAEFSLPRAEGDPRDGRLTVTSVGGSVEANVDRWREQFGGKPEKESQEEIDVGGVPVVLVDFSGTYNGQHGGMGQAAPAAEPTASRMRAAIFSVKGHQFIIKCTGPEKTMDQHADAFLAFINSLSSTPPGATKATVPTADKPKPEEPTSDEAKPDEPAAETEESQPESAGPSS